MLEKAIARLQCSSVKGFEFKARYDDFIGGKFVAPLSGKHFDNVSSITGQFFTQAARSNEADINLAFDAAHASADRWGKTPAAARALIFNNIADRLEINLDFPAYAETVGNGKPIRETMIADIPLSIDQVRYFASCILRAPFDGIVAQVRHAMDEMVEEGTKLAIFVAEASPICPARRMYEWSRSDRITGCRTSH